MDTARLIDTTAITRDSVVLQRIKRLYPALLLAVSILVIYWITGTEYNTFDAVSYSNQISHLYVRTGNSRWLFHPHHLLFNATGYVLWRLLNGIGIPISAIHTLETFNAIISAMGVFLIFHLVSKIYKRYYTVPIIASALVAVSYGYWVCATDARVNAPSNVLLICAFTMLSYMLENPRYRYVIAASIFSGLAVLYHESTGLFLLVGVTAILLCNPNIEGSRLVTERIKRLAVYVGIWSLIVGAAYLTIGTGVLHNRSVAEFKHWFSEYAELGWWWNFDILRNLQLDGYALRHATFVEPCGEPAAAHVGMKTPLSHSILYYVTLTGYMLAGAALVMSIVVNWRKHHHPLIIVCLVWIIVYSLFFTIWSPGYFVFWTPVIIPLTVISILLLSQKPGLGIVWKRLALIWIILIAMSNYIFSIAPHCTAGSSPFRRFAMTVQSRTHPGDLILVTGVGDLAQIEVDIPYFANRNCLSLHTSLSRHHDDQIQTQIEWQTAIASTLANGHNVYVTDDFYNTENLYEDLSIRHRNINVVWLKSLLKPWKKSEVWKDKHGAVWSLQ